MPVSEAKHPSAQHFIPKHMQLSPEPCDQSPPLLRAGGRLLVPLLPEKL